MANSLQQFEIGVRYTVEARTPATAHTTLKEHITLCQRVRNLFSRGGVVAVAMDNDLPDIVGPAVVYGPDEIPPKG